MTDDAGSTAAHERRALVQALQQAGPEADTLCQGWNAHDLAVHIVARDARPDTIFGQEMPLVADKAARAYHQFEQLSFDELVDRIQAGPPRWSPANLRQIGDVMNTVEFFVHTEDVLRAEDNTDDDAENQLLRRRSIPESVRRKLWQQASSVLFTTAARSKHQRITFISPGYGAVTSGRSRDPLLILHGAPEELVLWAFGREEVAAVTIEQV